MAKQKKKETKGVGGHKQGYYQAQRIRTAQNKARRAAKRAARKTYWLKRGKRKNGLPVSHRRPS